MMLYDVMRYCRNFFVSDLQVGDWTIENGSISLDHVRPGQHFMIDGSVFNDGVYIYGSDLHLTDESFDGTISALKIHPAFLRLVEDIERWEKENGEKILSPYTSESFGGYSYSRGSDAPSSWQDAFRPRLREWRRL